MLQNDYYTASLDLPNAAVAVSLPRFTLAPRAHYFRHHRSSARILRDRDRAIFTLICAPQLLSALGPLVAPNGGSGALITVGVSDCAWRY